MKFTTSSSSLKSVLQKAGSAISNNPTLPILEGFKFSLSGDFLKVSASDLDISAEIEMEVKGAGGSHETVIPGRKLMELLSKMGSVPVTIEAKDTKVTIKAGKGRHVMTGEDAGDFPRISLDVSSDNLIFSMNAGTLKRAVNSIIPCTSTDELRQAMCGIFVEVQNEKTIFTGTDAHKLATLKVDTETEAETDFILPRKLAEVIRKNLPDSGLVQVYQSEGNVIVKSEGLTFSGRKIDAKYPDYRQVIPADNDKTAIVDTSSLRSSLERVAIFANDKTNQVECEFDGGLKLKSFDTDFGTSSNEELECEFSGEKINIGFNSKYFLEMLKLIDGTEVKISMSNPTRAAVLTPENEMDGESFTGLLMPVII